MMLDARISFLQAAKGVQLNKCKCKKTEVISSCNIGLLFGTWMHNYTVIIIDEWKRTSSLYPKGSLGQVRD